MGTVQRAGILLPVRKGPHLRALNDERDADNPPALPLDASIAGPAAYAAFLIPTAVFVACGCCFCGTASQIFPAYQPKGSPCHQVRPAMFAGPAWVKK